LRPKAADATPGPAILSLRFARSRRLSTYLPPGVTGRAQPVRVWSEVRRDPLTGRSGRVAHFKGFTLVAPDLSTVVSDSRSACPFCPERVLEVTPLMPSTAVPSGRIRRGEAVLFPNISPYDRSSVVTVLSREHFLEANQFSSVQLVDGIMATIEYFRTLPRPGRGTHSVITWNYMPPSGATQVHAHLQAFSTNRPGSILEEEVRRSRTFWRRHRHPFWAELAEVEEAQAERFVARGRHTVWLTPFVSHSVISDAMALFPAHSYLQELGETEVTEFVAGLRLALAAFHDEGVRAFNLAFYAAPSGDAAPHFWLHARVSPRIYFNPSILGSDTSAWQHLLGESVMVRSPEALAARLQDRFANAFPRAGKKAPGRDVPATGPAHAVSS
jgi:UDPglucose--hexose-1-phosphate uridylyltransferase